MSTQPCIPLPSSPQTNTHSHNSHAMFLGLKLALAVQRRLAATGKAILAGRTSLCERGKRDNHRCCQEPCQGCSCSRARRLCLRCQRHCRPPQRWGNSGCRAPRNIHCPCSRLSRRKKRLVLASIAVKPVSFVSIFLPNHHHTNPVYTHAHTPLPHLPSVRFHQTASC